MIHKNDYTVDAPADDISYHMSCWTKYVLPTIELGLQSHLQNINLDDGRQLFFRHVDEIIFQKREIRALQWLLSDYKVIIGDYGIEVNDMKSSYLKELLVKEYGDSIGFQPPIQKNKSELVFDRTGSASYVEAAMNATGVSDELLMVKVCKRLHDKIIESKCVPWPPRIDQLEVEEDICESLIQLLSWLKHPKKKCSDHDAKTLSLASMITQHVTGRRTTTAINYGVDLHGHTQSKDLVQSFHKAGFVISYPDILYLYDSWSLRDISESKFIPRELQWSQQYA